MNSPIRSDSNGNYIIGKKNVYFSSALVVGIVMLSAYTVQRATSFEQTLEWNTRQVSQILIEQKKQGERLAEIERKAALLEYRVDRLDRGVVGDAGPLMGSL